jgi:hypothetical protein
MGLMTDAVGESGGLKITPGMWASTMKTDTSVNERKRILTVVDGNGTRGSSGCS